MKQKKNDKTNCECDLNETLNRFLKQTFYWEHLPYNIDV